MFHMCFVPTLYAQYAALSMMELSKVDMSVTIARFTIMLSFFYESTI